MKKKIIILSVLAMLAGALQAVNVHAQYVPCLKMICNDDPAHGVFNPDSIMYDSCKCSDRWDYYCFYAKTAILIKIPYEALLLPEFPRDTVFFREWTDIDSNFKELRNYFEDFCKLFCHVKLRKLFPDVTKPSSEASRSFILHFDKYLYVDSVISYFSKCIYIDELHLRTRWYEPEDVRSSANNPKISILPNPAQNDLYLNILDETFYLNKGLQPLVPDEQIKIYNIFGECVITLETGLRPVSTKIDVSGLPAGVYFVHWDGELSKFVKE